MRQKTGERREPTKGGGVDWSIHISATKKGCFVAHVAAAKLEAAGTPNRLRLGLWKRGFCHPGTVQIERQMIWRPHAAP